MFGPAKILAFHQTSDRFFPGINNVKPKQFWALLNFLSDLGYKFYGGEEYPEPRSLILSFDDGYHDNFNILMELLDRGIKPFVFIASDYIGRHNRWEYSSILFKSEHLNEDQIKILWGRGVIIGSHGQSHRALTAFYDGELSEELRLSKSYLEEITGHQVEFISYPFGRTNARVDRMASECGYKAGFLLNNKFESDFTYRRLPIYGIDTGYSIQARLTGTKFDHFKTAIINRLASGSILWPFKP